MLSARIFDGFFGQDGTVARMKSHCREDKFARVLYHCGFPCST
jgi:hypothetical protein